MDQLTLILAVWGAVVSSVALGWNVYRGLADKGHLRVTCYIGEMITKGGPKDPKDYLVWSVVNAGRQPVMLTQIGGTTTGKKGFLTIQTDLPKMLKPGEYHLGYSPDLTPLGPHLLNLGAWDSIGTFYKAPRKQINKLKTDQAMGLKT